MIFFLFSSSYHDPFLTSRFSPIMYCTHNSSAAPRSLVLPQFPHVTHNPSMFPQCHFLPHHPVIPLSLSWCLGDLIIPGISRNSSSVTCCPVIPAIPCSYNPSGFPQGSYSSHDPCYSIKSSFSLRTPCFPHSSLFLTIPLLYTMRAPLQFYLSSKSRHSTVPLFSPIVVPEFPSVHDLSSTHYTRSHVSHHWFSRNSVSPPWSCPCHNTFFSPIIPGVLQFPYPSHDPLQLSEFPSS